jgi:predicted Zn-dependent peptidase
MARQTVDTAVLANGVRVVTAPVPSLSRAHVFVQLRGGPVHEDDETWGISHLVEHMVFRGTDQHKDVRALTLSADDFGGDIAAATYRDRVAYDTRCDPDRLSDAFDLLAGMIAAPRFASLDVERAIIEEEISELFDDDGRDIDAENALFSRVMAGHPLARSIEGTVAQLNRFDKRAVRDFHARSYRGENVVVSVAGPLSPRAVAAAAKRAFGRVPSGGGPPSGKAPKPPEKKAAVHLIETEAPQTTARLCAPLPGFRHDDAAAAQVLARLLDDGPASRLQARIVDRDGLAYSVWAMADLYEERGVLELGGSVRPEHVGELVDALCRELRGVVTRPPSDDELSRIAARFARDLRDSLDDPSVLAEGVGKGALFQDPFRPKRAAAQIAAVKADDVRRLARIALASTSLQLVLSGSASRRAVAASRRAVESLRR